MGSYYRPKEVSILSFTPLPRQSNRKTTGVIYASVDGCPRFFFTRRHPGAKDDSGIGEHISTRPNGHSKADDSFMGYAVQNALIAWLWGIRSSVGLEAPLLGPDVSTGDSWFRCPVCAKRVKHRYFDETEIGLFRPAKCMRRFRPPSGRLLLPHYKLQLHPPLAADGNKDLRWSIFIGSDGSCQMHYHAEKVAKVLRNYGRLRTLTEFANSFDFRGMRASGKWSGSN